MAAHRATPEPLPLAPRPREASFDPLDNHGGLELGKNVHYLKHRRNCRADGNPFRIGPPPTTRGDSRNGTERVPSLRMRRIVPSNRRLRFDGPPFLVRRRVIQPSLMRSPIPARRVLHRYTGSYISPLSQGILRGAALLYA
jgi:hypothetical protein